MIYGCKRFTWNNDKNKSLKKERGISFEDVLHYIANGKLLDIIEHPNRSKYLNQRIFVIKIVDYVYLVPFVESETEIFLKTIIPSRKATKEYTKGGAESEGI